MTNEIEWSSSIKRDIYYNLHTAKRLTSNDVGQKWKAVHKRMKVDNHLLCCTKLNYKRIKWIKSLEIGSDTQSEKKKTGNMLEFVSMRKDFLNKSPVIQALRQTTDK